MGLFSRKKKEEFVSPMTGTLLPIEQCPDPVFAGKIMGDGFAIELTGAEVTAPVSGTIATAFPTGHAYGINTDDGKEILIHIGMDTVALNGQGKSVVSPVIFTSGEKVELQKTGAVQNGENGIVKIR